MFGFSFGELLVVMIVALFILGPEELVCTIQSLRKIASNIQNWYQSYSQYLLKSMDATSETEIEKEIVKYIIDLEGNVQKTYDLSLIMPDLKRTAEDENEHIKKV